MPQPEALVIDASAMVEALLGTDLGREVRRCMRGHELHAPAHMDAEVLSALGRLHRARELDQASVESALEGLAAAPIRRHPLGGLLSGAWKRRENQRLVDALYTQLAESLDSISVLTTDARLARSDDQVVLVAGRN